MILEAAEKHARAVRALYTQPWARDIVEKVTRQCRLRKCPTEGELFELRFGYEIYLAEIIHR